MKKITKKLMGMLLTGLLVIGLTAPAMTAQAADTEGINQFVTRLYQVCFGREPDAGGLSDWSNRLATGQETGAQVTYGFVFSQEFQNMNLCDSHYVDALYEAFFGRASDEAGKADWMDRLAAGQTRGAVMTGFVNSEEFSNLCASYGITQGTGDWGTANIAVNGACVKDEPTEGIYNFVTRLYTTCLERDADAAGVEDWANRLAHGDTGSNVAYGFVSSAEYQSKNADNEEYVNMLYRTMLGREADAAGLADWTGYLRSGISREEVFNGFLKSTEFGAFCKEAGIVVGDPVPFTPAGPEAQAYRAIIAMREQYPEGMRWTNENSYTSKALYRTGYGCAGFALILSDAAFGDLPGRQHTDFSDIHVGDILRINYDTHSVVVLEVKSDSVIVAEGNYNSSIHWGREISLKEIQETGKYVLTRYPQ